MADIPSKLWITVVNFGLGEEVLGKHVKLSVVIKHEKANTLRPGPYPWVWPHWSGDTDQFSSLAWCQYLIEMVIFPKLFSERVDRFLLLIQLILVVQ